MKIKRLIEILGEFDKNLEILVGDGWIERVDLVIPKPNEKYAIPYVSIIEDINGK